VLFTDKRYSSLSSDCKMMYALILDRASLSEKNNWVDSEGRVIIYFTFEEFCGILGWSREKVNKNLHQLTDCGLIDKKRQGLGKPSVIYVNESLFPNFSNSENRTSESTETELQEVRKPNGNNTDINNTDYNKTDTTTSSVWDAVREQIDYDFLCSVHNKNDIDEIVNVICDTIVCKCSEVRLNGGMIPHSLVVARMRILDAEHITYVLEVMSKNTEKIHNIRSYLLCLLYNAPSTMEAYYQMRVNTD
jgi:hypothetical protein